MKKIFSLLILFLLSIVVFAKDGDQAQMADVMRSNGRIYVVVAVILTILIGLILYLVRLDNKIKKLEQQIK